MVNAILAEENEDRGFEITDVNKLDIYYVCDYHEMLWYFCQRLNIPIYFWYYDGQDPFIYATIIINEYQVIIDHDLETWRKTIDDMIEVIHWLLKAKEVCEKCFWL